MFRPRRWPYVTTAIIAVNVLLFLFSHARLQQEANHYNEIESRTLSLAATHPHVTVTSTQQALIDTFRKRHSQEWDAMAAVKDTSAVLDEINEEMWGVAQELDDFQLNSWTARYAVYTPHRSALSSVTATFLHRDWVHLIFNTCFLWLVGGVLEDLWGRKMFTGILFVCGVLGMCAYILAYVDRLIPLMGSSGLVAALMGFYVIRFPKNTIQRGTALWTVRPRFLRFSSPVFVVFPMWVLGLGFWGKAASETTNVAYLAQGGACAAGMLLALLLRIAGVEEYFSQRIEAEVAWSADPHIALAGEHLERGDLDAAIDEVKAQIAEKPSSVEAHEMLVSLYYRKSDVTLKYQKALERLCEVQLNAANPEAAWEHYETYLKVGGTKMPAATWFQLARFAENQGNWERALTEYEEFARSWPNERASVMALISAARIHLQQFGRREEAVALYLAAKNSLVPHAEWDDIIRKGLEKAGATATAKVEKR